MTVPRRPVTRSKSLRRVPVEPPEPVAPRVVHVPWWWTALTGVLGGAATLGLGVWLTASGLTPDPFAMLLITLGATGLSGVSARPHLERLAADATRAMLNPGRNDP